MKIKLPLILLLSVLSSGFIYSQKIISLKECYDMAIKKSSIAGEKDAYSSVWQLKDKNLSKNWLPSLDANAGFNYNSEVIDLGGVFSSLPIPGLPGAIKPLPHEQYKVTIDINQMIYDGGSVKKAKAIEEADLRVNQQQTESDMYKLRSQVNTCYFSILLIDRQKELMADYLNLLDKRLKSMQSAVDNGAIIKSDIDIMTSERIKIDQQLSELDIKKASLLSVLSDLTGSPFGNESSLVLPQASDEPGKELSRPELKLFDYRKDQLEAGLGVLQSKRMPKAFGFATLGYGNPPGSNFFRNEFAPYYIVGAGIKWNIYDWDKVKNEKQQIRIQQGMLESRKSDLADNLKRSLELKRSEIISLQSALSKDSLLIALRKRITATSESQYDNGTITATELMNEMNSEKQAEINYEIHRISLVMAKIEYLNISGQNIE